ncbi:MAG: hypothetical protein QOJ92_1552 [Frankiales bacterium]|nr:hypothetical protein [Frankiales bacterium]
MLLRATLPAIEAAHGPDSVDVAHVLNQLAVACKFAGLYDEAEPYYARAMRIAETTEGAESDLVATLLHNIGGLAHSRRRHAEGVEPARRGLALRERLWGHDDVTVAADEAALAALLEGIGEYAEAEQLYASALAVYEPFGDEYECGMTHNGLGSACQAQERFDEAATHYRAAIAHLEKAKGPDHPDLGPVINNLATLHRRLGEDDEARALLARAHDLLVGTLGPEHPVTIEIAGNRRRVDASPSPYV